MEKDTVKYNEDGSYSAILNKSITLKGTVTMEDKTLNERILGIIESKIEYAIDGDDRVDTWGETDAVNEIEKLILSEIEKAFDAGGKYMEGEYEFLGSGIENKYPDKEEYIKSITK